MRTPLMLKYTHMQPNNYFYGATQQQAQPSYQYQQTPNIPTPKKRNVSTIICIILSVIIAGLVIFILIDKLIFKKSEIVTLEESARVDLSPLSQINPDEVAYKDALAGRIFTVDSTYHQYIKFISNEKYEYHYWRNPDTDHYYLIPSIDNGTFTVEGKEIKLSGGDSFKIVHNYLVKSANGHSSNTGTIYFDNYSLSQTSQRFDDALTSYIEKIRKADPTLAKVELARVSLDYLTCKADKEEIQDPDNEFSCTGTYVYYFNEDAAEKIIKDTPNYYTFHDVILYEKSYYRYSFNHIYTDNIRHSLTNRSPFTIKVNSDNSFRVTSIKDDYKLEQTDGQDS